MGLQPSVVQSNALAGRGSLACVYAVSSLANTDDVGNQDQHLALSIRGLVSGSEQVLQMPQGSTLGTLARCLADQHQEPTLVRLVMPCNVLTGPLDAKRPLAEF